MRLSIECIPCMVKKVVELANYYFKDEEKKFEFIKRSLRIISEEDGKSSSPTINEKLFDILEEEYGIDTNIYVEEKKYFNDLILKLEASIYGKLDDCEDGLLESIKYAMAGNIIDFGALEDVNECMVMESIEKSLKHQIDNEVYMKFKNELNKATHLCYLLDNAGEVVLDKVLIREIKKQYPNITISIITRGRPVYNDVTKEDAYYVGLDKYGMIVDNGTGIPGTDINCVSQECNSIIENSDLIISKGQGNFETLFGCGKNIYYLFLCKCDMLVDKLNKKKFECVFMHESAYRN
ncbi:DUF89 family protein [Mycoplasmatota bacterium]|nr:DUF89 family protein [Mycoplasmatota bacterium]